MKVVVWSDTHCLHEQVSLPDGDILIHAGDFTGRGKFDDIRRFNDFLGGLPHRYKVVIAGNHDWAFEKTPEEARALLTAATYLQDSEIVLEGIRIYGSPWQPAFFDWAFNLPRGAEIRQKWELIPEGLDILVTHGPPRGIGDKTRLGCHAGCQDLLELVELRRPRYHLFGHIHEGYGVWSQGGITYMNGSVCDVRYRPNQAPLSFEIEPTRPAGAVV
jgi:predicted phosphodiesterase